MRQGEVREAQLANRMRIAIEREETSGVACCAEQTEIEILSMPVAIHLDCNAARGSLEIQIHGERGALWLTHGGLSFSQRPLEQFGERPVEPVPLVPAAGEADLLRDFHAYVTRGVEPGVSARHNLETMAACEMMVRSISEGRTTTRAELEAER